MSELEIRRAVIPCSVGCLHHVVGITYFKWTPDPWNIEEPELYFETLHEPSEGFWKRLYRAYQFVVQRKPMGADSTLIGPSAAREIIDACEGYIRQHDRWREFVARPAEAGDDD